MAVTVAFRKLYVLHGDPLWSRSSACRLSQSCASQLWVGDESAPAGMTVVSPARTQTLLGREFDCVIYDGWAGVDPDALGIVSGLVRGGGVFLLLMPDQAALASFVDPQNVRITVYPHSADQLTQRWLMRLLRRIRRASNQDELKILSPIDGIPDIAPGGRFTAQAVSQEIELNQEQQDVLQAICLLPRQSEPGVVLLTADRGRGKSTVLGQAAARLIQQGVEVVVCAPSRARAAVLLQACEVAKASCRFVPPDELLRSEIAADLVIIDEASSLPGPVLRKLLNQYAQCVFAATLHGYEGSGRGFALRFQMLLDEADISCKRFQLTEPVRWPAGDPVERFFDDALLLDAEMPDWGDALQTLKPDQLRIQHLNRDELAADEQLLRGVFGLLVEAHYQTGPMDLRQMLDGPNISILIASSGGVPVAVVLAAREGGLDEAIMTAVQFGRRRPHGHLMPQTLTFAGSMQPSGGGLIGLRIVRIAVHPQGRRRGIGQHLLKEIELWATNQGVDYLGASFGLTSDLLRFWRQSDFYAVHLGLSLNKASALRSVMVVKPITPAASEELAIERQYFHDTFTVLQKRYFADVDVSSCSDLLAPPEVHAKQPALLRRYPKMSEAVASGHRGVVLSTVALRSLLSRLDRQCLSLEKDVNVKFVFSIVFDLRPWPESHKAFGFSGRREADLCFRQTLRSLLDCHVEH